MTGPEEDTRDTDRPPTIEVAIPAGRAQLAVTMAFAAVSRAIGELENAALSLEATATACARQLDAETAK